MILPIVAYGDPVLRKQCKEIEEIDPNLKKLIANMFDTMYNASGVGLAAPQVGASVRMFIIDASPFAEGEDADPSCADFKRVFINPIIYEESGEEWAFEEGCLSIPKIREDVTRQALVKIEYYNEDWELVEEELSGFPARVVQHEYDHIEGVLFIDKISTLKRTMLKGKLNDISKGIVDINYRMKFPNQKRK